MLKIWYGATSCMITEVGGGASRMMKVWSLSAMLIVSGNLKALCHYLVRSVTKNRNPPF